MYLARLDINGNLLWHRDLGGSGDDGYYGYGIANGSNSKDFDVHHHIGGYDYWVLDVDSSSNIVWDNCYGGADSDEFAKTICMATDGSIWLNGNSTVKSGLVDTSYGRADAWMVHIDSIGNFLSAKVLGSDQQDEGEMIYPLSNGNVIAGGYYSENNGSFSSLGYYDTAHTGTTDAFLAIFEPRTNVGEPNISLLNNSIEIYPNPSIGNFKVSLVQSFNYEYSVSITDLIGKEIYSGILPKYYNNKTIDTRDWHKGVYFVQVIGENGLKTVKKLLLE